MDARTDTLHPAQARKERPRSRAPPPPHRANRDCPQVLCHRSEYVASNGFVLGKEPASSSSFGKFCESSSSRSAGMGRHVPVGGAWIWTYENKTSTSLFPGKESLAGRPLRRSARLADHEPLPALLRVENTAPDALPRRRDRRSSRFGESHGTTGDTHCSSR